VERSQIQSHFNRGDHQKALDGLEQLEKSPWRDTTKLRCLRSMGHPSATSFADELKTRIDNRSANDPMTTSERNNQLRYIALVYAEQNNAKGACEIMSSLCEHSPKVAALHLEYAFALTNDSQLDLAEAELIRALELQPNNASAHAQLGRIYCRTGRADAGYNSYARAATLEPANPNHIQRLLYWSNYSERTSQQSNYQLTQLWVNKAFPKALTPPPAERIIDPSRQLKIGFVSPDFCAHAVSFFIVPLFESLSRTDFQIIAYSDTAKTDHVTKSIKALCDVWRDSSNSSDSELAEQISTDQIDILIDLNGHARGNRLSVFAKHVAPVQMSWLGYPSTTGLKAIDYRITDRIADPVGLNDDFFSEKLLRLPNGFLCYKPLETAPEIEPTESNEAIRFGCFGSLAKVSSLTFDCWAAAMLAVPNSTLYIKRQQLENNNAADYFLQQLLERGVAKDRVTLKTSNAKIENHLGEYNNIDIAFDTTPYNSTTTTLEALWMGVPVISLMGETHASRVTASILHRLNLSGLATKSVVEFANRAKELAEIQETLTDLRFGLRKRMRESSLMNNRQFSYEFGNTLRSKWRDWCDEKSATEKPDAPVEQLNDEEVK